MQKLIFLLAILLMGNIAICQVCVPDTNLIPGNSLIYPAPYQDTVPGSGITQVACINTPYDLVFHAFVPEQVPFLGFNVDIVSVELVSITNLPQGLQFACEPPNCLMPKNSAGCVAITGTPTTANTPGTYPIMLNFKFTTQQFGTLELTFPNETIAPGIYEIELLAETADCTNSNPRIPGLSNVHAFMDRHSGMLHLSFGATEMSVGNLRIFDMAGRLIESSPLQIVNGPNEIKTNINHFPQGAYLYRLDTGNSYHSGKFIR